MSCGKRKFDPLFMEPKRAHLGARRCFTTAESNWAAPDLGLGAPCETREIRANWWYFWWYGRVAGPLAAPILYSKSGADGRIRTGDPLFTKQLLCQLSYVGVRTDYMRDLLPQRKALFTKWRPWYAPAPGD